MRVSFILLAHEAPDALCQVIVPLLEGGADVFLHHDANSPHNIEEESKAWGLDVFQGNLHFVKRIKVVWGEWSIVEATLNCLQHAKKIGYKADYFMLISGSCMPTKPMELLRRHLASGKVDYIECVNAIDNKWVTDGLQAERWKNYQFLNWRNNPILFSLSNRIQSILRFNRELPLLHTPYMGSQWWCLRQSTIERILNLIEENPDLKKFYRRTWVPDELFFQTLVGNLINASEISGTPLTHYRFNSVGAPRIFFDDDFCEVLHSQEFFLRKISPRAVKLRKKLAEVSAMTEHEYVSLCEQQKQAWREDFPRQLDLARQEAAVSRTGLACSMVEDRHYVQGIPAPLLVFCSSNIHVRRRIAKKLFSDKRFQAFGEIFGEASRFSGEYENAILQNRASSFALAKHSWLSFLGEILDGSLPASFVLGSDAKEFTKVLQWKRDCCVVLVHSDWSECDFDASVKEQFDFIEGCHKEHDFLIEVKLSLENGVADIIEIDGNSDVAFDHILNRFGGPPYAGE